MALYMLLEKTIDRSKISCAGIKKELNCTAASEHMALVNYGGTRCDA